MTQPVPACPHSGESLGIRDAEGHVGHLCAGCRGLWLPRRYLAAIAHQRRFAADRFAELLAGQPRTPSELACPAGCGGLLRATVKGVEVDWCEACGGVWFDRGEMAMLLSRYPPRASGGDDGLDVGDVIDIADVVSGLFDLFS